MLNRSPAAMRLLLLVVSAWAVAMPGSAQSTEDSEDREPAHIAYIDGSALVTHEGRADEAALNVPLVSGDQVRTREGRMEVRFGDGSVLDIDHFTTVDFLSDELVRLTEGRIRVTIGGRDRVEYRVDTPSAAIRIEEPGEYRISLVGDSGRRDVELVAIRGYATLVNALGETGVRAGERAFAAESMAPSYAQAYNSATWDAFDRWAEDRRDERTGAASAQYLPDEIRGYAGAFDRYGAWQYDVSYGYVWYPRVRVDWRPYYHGRWSYYGPWGWTWIAYDPWGWPTHHYGRWGFRAGVWFWIPSRRWAPAYVYWAGASDYIGWCPLGWDNRPIFNIINVNIGRGYRGYDPYRAWTVVPRRAFARHVEVGRYAVARSDIDRAVPRWYVSGASAPLRPTVSTRDVLPIYSAGRGTSRGAVAVPRDDSTPRAYGRRAPAASAPRTTPPAAPASLGPAAGWAASDRPRRDRANSSTGERAVTRGAAPYRDAGPGGPDASDVPYNDRGNTAASRPPGASDDGSRQTPRARPRYRDAGPGGDDRGPRPQVGAPTGVPSGGIYGQRGVPRDENDPAYGSRGLPRTADGIYAPGPRGGVYDRAPSRPSRRQPADDGRSGVFAPSDRDSGVFAPSDRDSGVFAPRDPDSGVFAPPRSVERPSYGRPPRQAPSSGPPPAYRERPGGPPPSRGAPAAERPSGGDGGGGSRGGERAASRGGGGSSRAGAGHARPRPQ